MKSKLNRKEKLQKRFFKNEEQVLTLSEMSKLFGGDGDSGGEEVTPVDPKTYIKED
ncbi:MAG TPA: hypothetical protein PK563_12250 [Tenuifilaceae bacterium]|nr:hypothetical protein [Tenuifilaceae bacterium]